LLFTIYYTNMFSLQWLYRLVLYGPRFSSLDMNIIFLMQRRVKKSVGNQNSNPNFINFSINLVEISLNSKFSLVESIEFQQIQLNF
jgi:hypothetical protein